MMRVKFLITILAATVLTAGTALCFVQNMPIEGEVSQLVPPAGNILIIDDAPVEKTVAPKYDASGRFLAPGYVRSESQSADRFVIDLELFNYVTTVETMATTDTATWWDYDILLISCGDNTNSLDDADFRAKVVAFVDAGGHLLLEGGEVGFSHKGDGEFATKVMHTTDWNHDESGTLDVADPGHFVMSTPNLISNGTVLNYEGWGDQDSMVPLADAQFAGAWSDYPAEAGVICYDPNPAPEGGQVVFYTFNYDKLEGASAQNLLLNSLSWLMTPESGVSTISGTVTLGGETDHSSVLVELTPRYVSTTTDAAGYYEFTNIFGDDYTVNVSKANWHPQTADVAVVSGGVLADVDFTLLPVIYGEFSGVVTDFVTATPLSATVKVFDTVSGDLIVEIDTDPDTGAYVSGTMPYGNYDLVVYALGYAQQRLNHELNVALVDVDFALSAVLGTFLLVDDHVVGSKTVDSMVTDLIGLGYHVEVETLMETDPMSWDGYDLLIVSCGDSFEPLNDPSILVALSTYTQAGGHLLLEGGEIGLHHNSNTDFMANVMHATEFNGDPQGNVIATDSAHPVMSTPNVISSISTTLSMFRDSDGLAVAPDAVMIGGWDSDPEASIIGYDPTLSPVGGQIAYYTFNYLALDAIGRVELLENTVAWLVATESLPTAAISGIIELSGETDYSGTLVELSPDGGSMVTGPDGTYGFTNLFATTYTLQVSQLGWAPELVMVDIDEGEIITNFDLILEPELILESCNTPVFAIPDNDPLGISDIISMPLSGNCDVTGIEVFLDITHTFLADLLVTLTSPLGTTVDLHNESGGGGDNIYGWYPDELTPDGDLEAFIGEGAGGDWTLSVSDNASFDSGTLNEWCLKVFYVDLVPVAAGAMTASPSSDGVVLVWEYETSMIDGFHVYRRDGTNVAERLTDELVSNTSGRIEYLDTPYGFASNTDLYYSYTLVVDGNETPQSSEVKVVFNSAPTHFTMHRNYPNPFNPMTTIKFELPKPGRTKLQVIDLSGRVVRTLVDENLPAAIHQREWNGTNDRGRRLASGTYYFRLTSDGHIAVQKVLLMK